MPSSSSSASGPRSSSRCSATSLSDGRVRRVVQGRRAPPRGCRPRRCPPATSPVRRLRAAGARPRRRRSTGAVWPSQLPFDPHRRPRRRGRGGPAGRACASTSPAASVARAIRLSRTSASSLEPRTPAGDGRPGGRARRAPRRRRRQRPPAPRATPARARCVASTLPSGSTTFAWPGKRSRPKLADLVGRHPHDLVLDRARLVEQVEVADLDVAAERAAGCSRHTGQAAIEAMISAPSSDSSRAASGKTLS